MKFSQRLGKTPAKKDIQIESLDDDLLNGIWNIFKMVFLDKLDKGYLPHGSEFNEFTNILWHKFYKLPFDKIPYDQFDAEQIIRKKFFNSEWYEIYDFIEFIIEIQNNEIDKNNMVNAMNVLFEREFSGYRLIEDKIAPISNQTEFNEVSDALEKTKYLTALKGANIHLTHAIEFISDKKNPNFRNSIKESISAVESTCRIITGENTLGKALKKMESKGLNINNLLKAGFDKIYAYTNDKENGIRHAIVIQPMEPDFADAKYMLISCSAFINYLVYKAEKIGLKLN